MLKRQIYLSHLESFLNLLILIFSQFQYNKRLSILQLFPQLTQSLKQMDSSIESFDKPSQSVRINIKSKPQSQKDYSGTLKSIDNASLRSQFQKVEKQIIEQFKNKRKIIEKFIREKHIKNMKDEMNSFLFQIKEGEPYLNQNAQASQKGKKPIQNDPTDQMAIQKTEINKSNEKDHLCKTKMNLRNRNKVKQLKSVCLQTTTRLFKIKKIKKGQKVRSPKNLQQVTSSRESNQSNRNSVQKNIESENQIKTVKRKRKISKKSPEDIAELRKQIASMIMQQQDLQTSSYGHEIYLTESSNDSSKNYSSQTKQGTQASISYQKFVKQQMSEKNNKIQNFYKNKRLRQIILGQFYRKYNLSQNKKSKRLNSLLTKSKKQIKKKNEKIQKLRILDEKLKKYKRISKVNCKKRVMLNQKFKIALIQEQKINRQATIKQITKNWSDIFQTKRYKNCTKINDEEDEKSFNSIQAWNIQFKFIYQNLLQKYPSLIKNKKIINYSCYGGTSKGKISNKKENIQKSTSKIEKYVEDLKVKKQQKIKQSVIKQKIKIIRCKQQKDIKNEQESVNQDIQKIEIDKKKDLSQKIQSKGVQNKCIKVKRKYKKRTISERMQLQAIEISSNQHDDLGQSVEHIQDNQTPQKSFIHDLRNVDQSNNNKNQSSYLQRLDEQQFLQSSSHSKSKGQTSQSQSFDLSKILSFSKKPARLNQINTNKLQNLESKILTNINFKEWHYFSQDKGKDYLNMSEEIN